MFEDLDGWSILVIIVLVAIVVASIFLFIFVDFETNTLEICPYECCEKLENYTTKLCQDAFKICNNEKHSCVDVGDYRLKQVTDFISSTGNFAGELTR